MDIFKEIKENKLKVMWGWPQVCVGEIVVSAREDGIVGRALSNAFMKHFYIPKLRGLHNFRTRNSPNRKFEDSEAKKKFIELEDAANQKHRKTLSYETNPEARGRNLNVQTMDPRN